MVARRLRVRGCAPISRNTEAGIAEPPPGVEPRETSLPKGLMTMERLRRSAESGKSCVRNFPLRRFIRHYETHRIIRPGIRKGRLRSSLDSRSAPPHPPHHLSRPRPLIARDAVSSSSNAKGQREKEERAPSRRAPRRRRSLRVGLHHAPLANGDVADRFAEQLKVIAKRLGLGAGKVSCRSKRRHSRPDRRASKAGAEMRLSSFCSPCGGVARQAPRNPFGLRHGLLFVRTAARAPQL
jgi:hypothetical protein